MPKKIIISKNGGPEVLKYVEYDLDENIGGDCIRINNLSIGVNYIDTYHRSGVYPTQLPTGLGLEGVGRVIGVGKNITEFSVGDRVGYTSTPIGAYSETRDYPANKVFKIPDFISDDDAASILLQGMTVEYLFNRTYKVDKKETILFHAVAGGVGLIACQWAKSIGCKIIGTVSTKEKGDVAKENGCTHVINYKKDDALKKIMEITEGRGVPVVYDGVGKDTFDLSLACLSKRGLFVSFGQASGMVPEVGLHKSFGPKSLYFTRPTLLHYNDTSEKIKKSSFCLFEMIKNGSVKPNLSKVYDLQNAASAHIDLQSRKTIGSIILKP